MTPRPPASPVLEHDRRFELFGSHVRLLIGSPVREGIPEPEAMGIQIEFFLRLLHHKLARFDAESELSKLNANPGETCRVSTTLAVAVDAALWAAGRSEGLVDPTLVGELEDAGYVTSRAGVPPAAIEDALAVAPDRRPAQARRDSLWQAVAANPLAGVVRRPPGPAPVPDRIPSQATTATRTDPPARPPRVPAPPRSSRHRHR